MIYNIQQCSPLAQKLVGLGLMLMAGGFGSGRGTCLGNSAACRSRRRFLCSADVVEMAEIGVQ